MVMMPRVRRVAKNRGSYEKKISIVGLGLLALMWIILFSCLYFANDYPQFYPGLLAE